MKSVKVVPKPFLQELASNPNLYADCPIEVKRQIWESDPILFRTESLSVLKTYIKHQQQHLSSSIILPGPRSLNLEPPRRRRQVNTHLKLLVNVIGQSTTLYESVLNLIRSLYLESGDVAFCSLRSELLLSYLDAGQSMITEYDPCRKIASLMDTSITEGIVDTARASEMEKSLLKCSRSKVNNPIIGDVAMIVRDPYAMGVLLTSIWIRTSNYLIPQELLPKDDDVHKILTKLLHLGNISKNMFSSKIFKEDETALAAIIHHFYPALIMNMLQNQMNQPLQTEHDSFLQLILEDPTARKIALYYGLMCCSQRDAQSTLVILDLLGEFEPDELASELWFFQALLRELSHLQSQLPLTQPTQECVTALVNQLVNKFSYHVVINKEIQQFLSPNVPKVIT